MFRSHIIFIFIICVVSLVSCQDEDPKQTDNPKSDTVPGHIEIAAANLAGNFSTQSVLKIDSTQLDQFFTHYPALTQFKNMIHDFYAGRDFAFAWYDINGQIEQAGNLFNRIENLDLEGLYGEVPYINDLDSLMGNVETNDEKVRFTTELMLTAQYFYFAEKVWGGLDEKQTRKINWFLPRKRVDYERWLDTLLKVPDAFSKTREPIFRQYNLLKPYLQSYKDLSQQHSWQTLKTGKTSFRMGDSAEILIEIKQRLLMLGDLPEASKSRFFDTSLENGVKRFQKRFGMIEDGTIGPKVISELNVPMEKRILQITVNMERSRWVPDAIKGDYLAVNIPEFVLHAYRDGSLIWDMNVVVGKSVTKTVIFSGDLKYVVFSPYWNVPSSILKNEVLPGIRKNKNYLATHHMEWNGNGVRQKPGPWNSLGQVKFLFPNSFSIYLHDTPSKGLFKDENRAFSHGCIRVAEPKKLASYLLHKDPSWNETKISRAMSSGKEQYVTLKETIPVFIAYFTAWVDREGKLNFRDDVYNRDSRLAEMVGK